MSALLKAGAYAGAVTAIAAAVAVFDLTPATKSEMTVLAGSVQANRLSILYGERRYWQDEAWRLEDRIEQLRVSGRDASDAVRRLRQVQEDIRRIDRQIADERKN